MRNNEIVYGVIFLLLSVFFFLMTFRFPEMTIALSPAVFPRFVTTCLFILSAILIIQGIRRGIDKREDTKESPAKRAFVLRFILMAAIGFVYTRIISISGYVVATPFFIAGSMIIFNEKKWYRILLVSILTTAALFSIFRMVFRVPLPRFSLW